MLINKTSNSIPVYVVNTNVVLGGYEVMVLAFTPWSSAMPDTDELQAVVGCGGLSGYPSRCSEGLACFSRGC